MSKHKEPNINISKVYTKSGDLGKTSLIGGEKVLKNDSRVVSYGDIDELNVLIGICSNLLKNTSNNEVFNFHVERLISIQNELFNLGTVLASTGGKNKLNLPHVTNRDIELLEKDIDTMNKSLDSLNSFALPSGNAISLSIHHARVVCRRCERSIVDVLSSYKDFDNRVLVYINRLSDYLFVLGRYVVKKLDVDEELWNPNNITSIIDKE